MKKKTFQIIQIIVLSLGFIAIALLVWQIIITLLS